MRDSLFQIKQARSLISMASLFLILPLLLLACSFEATPLPTEPATSILPSATLPPPQATASETAPPPSATPTPECVFPAGRLENLSYSGHVQPIQIPLRVFLPPCYERLEEPLPVLYVLHGLPYDQNHWDDLGIDEAASQGQVQNALPPFIIVMPYQPENLFRSTDGGPRSYESEFIDGLLPFIEQTFNVRVDANGRALAGISRGGVWSLEIAFRNPDLIQSVVSMSPALTFNHARPAYDPLQLALSQPSLPPNILLLAGDNDWALPATRNLVQILEDGGKAVTFLQVAGIHEDALWAAQMEPLLSWVSAIWSGPR